MSQSAQDILPALIVVLLVACILVLLWFVLMRPGIKARQQAAALSVPMGFTPISTAAFDQEFCMGGMSFAVGMACAVGQCNGQRAGFMLQAARSKYVGPYTLAIVSGQYTRASALSLQRGKAAFGMEPTAFTGLMASTFIAYGSVAELARVFGADVQAKLCDFPRKLLGVYCNKNFIWLTWEGVEAVPAVCDQAIRLAAEIAGIKL